MPKVSKFTIGNRCNRGEINMENTIDFVCTECGGNLYTNTMIVQDEIMNLTCVKCNRVMRIKWKMIA